MVRPFLLCFNSLQRFPDHVGPERGYSSPSGCSSSRPSRCAFRRSSRRLARSAARFTSSEPTSSIIACSAPSPLRGPRRDDAGVAAVALAEPRAQRVEQLLHRRRRPQHHGRLTARVQRIRLGQRDHLLDQRLDRFGLGNRGDDALLQNHAGGEIAQQRIAASTGPLEFESGNLVSHAATPLIWSCWPSSSGP